MTNKVLGLRFKIMNLKWNLIFPILWVYSGTAMLLIQTYTKGKELTWPGLGKGIEGLRN